jgi:hypothetical protein
MAQNHYNRGKGKKAREEGNSDVLGIIGIVFLVCFGLMFLTNWQL